MEFLLLKLVEFRVFTKISVFLQVKNDNTVGFFKF